MILMERTAHLANYTFLQEMLINIKTRHFHSSINHQEHLFHRTLYHQLLSSYEYCKILRTAFLQYTSRSSHSQMFFKAGVLKSFPHFTGKHLCWSLFFKSLQAEGLFSLKKSPIQVFSCDVCKILKNTFPFFYRAPWLLLLHFRWLLLYFFKKSN